MVTFLYNMVISTWFSLVRPYFFVRSVVKNFFSMKNGGNSFMPYCNGSVAVTVLLGKQQNGGKLVGLIYSSCKNKH